MQRWTAGSAADGYCELMEAHFYLGCVDDEPVVTGMLDLPRREVGAIFVLPGFMGRGYALQMLDHLETLARGLGLEQVVLDATLNAATADFNSLQSQASQKLREAERIDALYRRHMVSEQQKDDADSAFRTAQANLMASKARMTQARVNRGLSGDDNLLLRQARNHLAQAELNLAYSQVHASQDGIITNLQLKPGSVATAGSPLLALVSEQVDVIADFREKSLRNITPQSRALVAFDGEPGRLYPARVASLDAGVSAGQFDANGLLANPIESDRWVRDAQRLRLHLTLEQLPAHLPAGARATVQLLPDNALTGLLARGQIRLLSLLHYIY